MSEQRVTCVPYGVRYACDTCRVGEMEQVKIATGSALVMDHSNTIPRWRHQCNKCEALADLEHAYPTVKFDIGPLPGPNQ